MMPRGCGTQGVNRALLAQQCFPIARPARPVAWPSAVAHRCLSSCPRGGGVSLAAFASAPSLAAASAVGAPRRQMQQVQRMGVHCRSLQTGIVGLPNVGKSTLFNALVEQSQAQSANFPFCTIEPNKGTVQVPDERLEVLSGLSNSKSKIAAAIEFVDIAGLVKGASKGEGLGNQFLSHIREVDAVVHVVRCFDDPDVIHVDGSVDPVRDSEVINLELVLADMAVIEKRLDKLKKGTRGKKAVDRFSEDVEKGILQAIYAKLEQGLPARDAKGGGKEEIEVFQQLSRELGLLTAKPMIYAANVTETDLEDGAAGNTHLQNLRGRAGEEGAEVVVVCARMEEELIDLEGEEKAEFLREMGVQETGLSQLIRLAYKILGLKTYFTTGEKETRAWTIKDGMTAPQAAGVIHTDFEKGFIRAETVSYDDFTDAKSLTAARERGVLRSEGKDYLVTEGDVILFRFNV